MPEIDPTIPLQTKVPGGRPLRDAYDRQRQLKIMSLQGQQAQLNIERLEREKEDAENKREGQRIQNELMKNNTSTDPDGNSTTNHQAIIKGLNEAGYPEDATRYELGINQATTARLNADTATLRDGMNRTKALGDLLGSCINAPEGDKRAECYRRGIAAAKDMGIGEDYPDEYTSDMLPDLESFYRMAVTVQGDTAATLRKREQEELKIDQQNKEERAKGMGILAQWAERKKTDRLARSIWDPNATDADGNQAPIDNSAAYHSLSADQKAELVPMLTTLGFTNWSKQPAERERAPTPVDPKKTQKEVTRLTSAISAATRQRDLDLSALRTSVGLTVTDPYSTKRGELKEKITPAQMQRYRFESKNIVDRATAKIESLNNELQLYTQRPGARPPGSTSKGRWDPVQNKMIPYVD